MVPSYRLRVRDTCFVIKTALKRNTPRPKTGCESNRKA